MTEVPYTYVHFMNSWRLSSPIVCRTNITGMCDACYIRLSKSVNLSFFFLHDDDDDDNDDMQ